MIEVGLHSYTEQEERPQQNLVMIMYPDARTTGGIYQARGVIQLGFLEKQFLAVIGENLQVYKDNGFEIAGIVYADTDEETFSPLYPRQVFSKLLRIPVPFTTWRKEDHQPQLDTVIDTLGLQTTTQVVLGGYHNNDCVLDMAEILRRRGIEPQIDVLLTNELGPLIVSREVEKRLRK